MASGEETERRRVRDYPYLPIIVSGAIFTLAVVLTTTRGIPEDPESRAAVYAILGVGMTVIATFLTEKTQGRIARDQSSIKNFLMRQVNSRPARTNAVIELCKEAETEFCAVTYFPVVGIQDDPDFAPLEYLNTLEGKLAKGVKVVLVSVSCAEARKYCEETKFSKGSASIKALARVEGRLTYLRTHFPDDLTVITVPGSAITVNVCHNDSTALLYHMSPVDEGSGFQSNYPLVLDVAKGGAQRYAYSHRNGGRPAAG